MANITPSYTDIAGLDDNYAKSASYGPMANGDVGIATTTRLAAYADRSAQVEGTFGAGGTVLIEGTNDGTNWRTLTDPLGNLLSITAAGIKQVTEAVLQMRPRVSAGDGTTSLTVTFALRRSLR